MKTLTVGLGILTILAVTGAMTPSGQAMLGLRPSPATSSVHVIKDTTQPAANTPAPSAAAESNMPAAKPAVGPQARPVTATPRFAPQTRPVAARSAARPVTAPSAVPAQRSASYPAPSAPPTAQAGPQTGASPFPGGLSSAGSVANILLNLPQVLQQTQVGPFGGNSSGDSSQGQGQEWRYRHVPQGQQWKHGGGDDQQQGSH
jgi:hypothetical protein